MFSFAEMEISYNARKFRDYEADEIDPDFAIERCAAWLGDTNEGRQYLMKALQHVDEFDEDLEALLKATQDTYAVRKPEDFMKVGQKACVMMDKWINKVAEEDYEEILQITNFKVVESDGL